MCIRCVGAQRDVRAWTWNTTGAACRWGQGDDVWVMFVGAEWHVQPAKEGLDLEYYVGRVLSGTGRGRVGSERTCTAGYATGGCQFAAMWTSTGCSEKL